MAFLSHVKQQWEANCNCRASGNTASLQSGQSQRAQSQIASPREGERERDSESCNRSHLSNASPSLAVAVAVRGRRQGVAGEEGATVAKCADAEPQIKPFGKHKTNIKQANKKYSSNSNNNMENNKTCACMNIKCDTQTTATATTTTKGCVAIFFTRHREESEREGSEKRSEQGGKRESDIERTCRHILAP